MDRDLVGHSLKSDKGASARMFAGYCSVSDGFASVNLLRMHTANLPTCCRHREVMQEERANRTCFPRISTYLRVNFFHNWRASRIENTVIWLLNFNLIHI